jgi:hypothetical protein
MAMNKQAQVIRLLTCIGKVALRVPAETLTVQTEVYHGYTQFPSTNKRRIS